jgi:hypothetical protein
MEIREWDRTKFTEDGCKLWATHRLWHVITLKNQFVSASASTEEYGVLNRYQSQKQWKNGFGTSLKHLILTYSNDHIIREATKMGFHSSCSQMCLNNFLINRMPMLVWNYIRRGRNDGRLKKRWNWKWLTCVLIWEGGKNAAKLLREAEICQPHIIYIQMSE